MIFNYLSALFPIACSSDEFWFFPQVIHDKHSLSRWDIFSNETISECCQKLSRWNKDIQTIINTQTPSNAIEIDAYLITNMMQTLQEHLEHFRPWERQPTFHLTIACIGLAQALTYGNNNDLNQRVSTLPEFLKRAGDALKNVPVLFMTQGLNMINDTRIFFKDCLSIIPEIELSITALDEFYQKLSQMKTQTNYLIPATDYAYLVKNHMQTRLDLSTISEFLEQEIHYTTESMIKSHPDSLDHLTLTQKSIFKPEKNSMIDWFSTKIQQLKKHCEKNNFIHELLKHQCRVNIAYVPDFLKTIRTASSYSFSPFQNNCQGTFYVLSDETRNQKGNSQLVNIESPMLTAHETYPGHHLLDASRSLLPRWIRRHLESPLFYEGWACLGEILMLETGFYDTKHATWLINKRRLWRAIRGKIDLNINCGKMTFDEAADLLASAGISQKRAHTIVRQYPLHPGYQLCYSLGLKYFLDLRSQTTLSMEKWVQTILLSGEIPFYFLEKRLGEK